MSSAFLKKTLWPNSIGRFCIPLLKHRGFRTEVLIKKASSINEGGNHLMRRKRVYSDIDKDLCTVAEAKAKKLGISRAKLIEIALESELERFNVHKENKRLTTARAQAEEALKQIASHLGVPDTVEHCKQRIDELQASIEDKKKERDCFKAKFENVESDYRTCDEKLTLLLTRSWWERLWNTLPWVE